MQKLIQKFKKINKHFFFGNFINKNFIFKQLFSDQNKKNNYLYDKQSKQARKTVSGFLSDDPRTFAKQL